jgi:hypothetical protein
VTPVVDGEAASAALARALDRVAGLVPHLKARIAPAGVVAAPDTPETPGAGAPGVEGKWIACDALTADPPWLGRIIRDSGSGLGTQDPVVAASLFVQGYSYRVLTMAVACATAAGIVPDASAPRMAIGLERHWPSRVAYRDPAVLVSDVGENADVMLRFLVDRAVDRHLAPLIAAVRSGLGVGVGERLLWGDVAASAATAFRTMAGVLGTWVEPLGEQFFAMAPPPLRGLGAFCVIEEGGRRGWFWERSSCCLFDRVPAMVRCADCSLTPAAERRRVYRALLATT